MSAEITNYSKLAREKNHRVLIIGAGFMGSGLACGIITAELPVSVTVCDIDPGRLEYIADFAKKHNGGENKKDVFTAQDAAEAAAAADVIILAVKPAIVPG
ncbi:MAG: NAD(P)-binding domain-containing protein, partial [Abditibacteriota bacterium]|nr:NAD(P)-binding domain-containing protein [Abditibacteriota bacterium]